MKPLRYPTNRKEHEYMKGRQQQNRANCIKNENERWFLDKLGKTAYKWTQQAQWGYRIFDFWSFELGVAIEIDGSEHKVDNDHYRDEYNFRRSGIVVLRVRNRNEEDAALALGLIEKLGTWHTRRSQLGLNVPTKKGRRKLAELPVYPSLLKEFLSGFQP